MRIKTKILLLLSGTFIVINVLFGTFVYYLTSEYGYVDFYLRLEKRANIAIQVEKTKKHDRASILRFRDTYLERLPGEKTYLIPITKNLSNNLSHEHLHLNRKFIQAILKKGRAENSENGLLQFGKRIQFNNTVYVVITEARNAYFFHFMDYLGQFIVAASIVILAFIIGVSYLLSDRILRPIRTIIQQINQIGTQNLNTRIPSNSNSDELDELRNTLNEMFDRLDTSFETQKNFVSNASHELNTPLTKIIGHTDFILQKERSIEEYKNLLVDILNQADSLQTKTKSLLMLAQTGFRTNHHLSFENVRLDELIFSSIQTAKSINSLAQFTFDTSFLPDDPKQITIDGNEQLLMLALTNIMLNGAKYSKNELVYLSLKCENNFKEIEIKDNGIGIPKDEIKFIYDPFYRATNTNQFEGYGIGLPLARNIIRMHKGKLLVQSEENHGTTVKITLV